MNYKRTMHIEYQAPTYFAQQDLERRIVDAVYLVLEHDALSQGLMVDANQGDRTITDGWADSYVGVRDNEDGTSEDIEPIQMPFPPSR